MMGEIILRLGSELLVLLSLFGWGEAVCARLSLRMTPFQGGAIGLCVFVVLGGLLGALGCVRSFRCNPVVLVFSAGALAGLFYLRRRIRDTAFGWRDLWTALPFLAAGLAVMAVAQHGFWFSSGDDMQGYLPLIQKLSDTGVMGDSSFSEKRLLDLGRRQCAAIGICGLVRRFRRVKSGRSGNRRFAVAGPDRRARGVRRRARYSVERDPGGGGAAAERGWPADVARCC